MHPLLWMHFCTIVITDDRLSTLAKSLKWEHGELHDAGKDRHSTDGHISAIFQKGGVEAHGYDTFTSLHDKDGRTECQTWQGIGGLQTEVFHTDAESCPLAEEEA